MTEFNGNSGEDSLVCLECGAEVGMDQQKCPSCGSERHLMRSDRGGSELPRDTPVERRTRPAVYSAGAITAIIILSLVLINALQPPEVAAEDPVDEEIAVAMVEKPDPVDPVEEEILSTFNENLEDDFGSLFAEGEWHKLRGEWPEAITAFEKALAIRNDDVATIEELVKAYTQDDDPANALFHLNRWIQIDAANPTPHSLKGSILYGQGKHDEARKEFRASADLAGDETDLQEDYSAKADEIDENLAERDRLAEEKAKYDIGEGWVHEETSGFQPKPTPETETPPVEGSSPLTQFLQQKDEDDPDDGSVLLGEGVKEDAGKIVEEESTETSGEEQTEDPDETEAEQDEGQISIEMAEGTVTPEHVLITGARYDASEETFSIYLDTNGRANPKYYYDTAPGVIWLTIPNADCDFTKVPLERTFTKTFVTSIKTWGDEEGNTRFKIILKEPVHFTSPTVMSLGFSLHLRRIETKDDGEDEE